MAALRAVGLIALALVLACSTTSPRARKPVSGINACSVEQTQETRALHRAMKHAPESVLEQRDFHFAVGQRSEVFAPCVAAFRREIGPPVEALIRLSVAPDGSADGCVAEASTDHQPYLDCLVGAIHTLRFRAVTSTVTTVFPLLLRGA